MKSFAHLLLAALLGAVSSAGFAQAPEAAAPATAAATKAMLKGQLVAWDPVAQKARWTVDHPYFWNAGVLSTAGGLVFQGSAEGFFSAYDAASGKKLWSYETGNGVIAAPRSRSVSARSFMR